MIEDFHACCMFDIFAAFLCLDYVINYETADLTLVCNEVCRQIQHLNQSFKDKHGQFVQNHPNELFCQYISLIPEFPENTMGRTMPLGHALFSSLDEDI